MKEFFQNLKNKTTYFLTWRQEIIHLATWEQAGKFLLSELFELILRQLGQIQHLDERQDRLFVVEDGRLV